MFSLRTKSVIVLVTFGEMLSAVLSETVGAMTAPPKHKGVFFKKQTGLNKTIPYSENPGKEMIVFDVDGTLWPYQIDSDPIFQDPFTIKSLDNGTVLVGNHSIHIFPEVEETLLELIEKGYVLAAVSLTNSTHKTMAVLNAFDLSKHFKHMEMGPGPDKLSLLTEICTRTGLLHEDVLYFEKDPGEVFDMLWRHVIVYCIDENGLTKDRARKGLQVFDIRPRKERRQHLNSAKKEFSDKNKSRPAKERDGTELEGMIHNGLQEKTNIDFESILFLMYIYTRSEIHGLLDLDVSTLPVGVSGISWDLVADALFIFSTRRRPGDVGDDEPLPATTESQVQRKLRLKQKKLKQKELKKQKKSHKNKRHKESKPFI